MYYFYAYSQTVNKAKQDRKSATVNLYFNLLWVLWDLLGPRDNVSAQGMRRTYADDEEVCTT